MKAAFVSISLSLLFHLSGLVILERLRSRPAPLPPSRPATVQLTLKELAPPPPPAPATSTPTPRPSLKKPTSRKTSPSRKEPASKPIQPEAVVGGVPGGVPGGKVGGVVGGQGIMVAVDVDLSTDAQLIAASLVKPVFTPEALEANISGRFTVEVFVDATGKPTQADLARPIGYGMDQRVIDAILRARFTPRRDRSGTPLPGWTSLPFVLQID